MNSMPMRRLAVGAAVALAATIGGPGAAFAAGVPDALAKLKGSSEASASDALSRAGYRLEGAKENWKGKDAFWWSDRNSQCLRLTTRLGVVSGVAAVAPADCSGVVPPIGVVPGRPGALVASDLLGLSRKGGEAKLTAAGFNALWVDEGKPDGVYMMWFNQRTGQCIAATVVGDRFDVASDQPASKCR